ncbi:50S ribosomal protein L34, chloroplastic [Hevea brasiliensis]|uniref:50S ribosomal protein L34, chloroplastic n=1 Tax=Hevea brasiliensis TaxID=3981 RepID=UPI0025F9C465|nr:50S ribosomal protein L34, chloroplastic [Hevea brasiliensis]
MNVISNSTARSGLLYCYGNSTARSGLLHCSFLSSSLSIPSSYSESKFLLFQKKFVKPVVHFMNCSSSLSVLLPFQSLSLGLDLNSNNVVREERGYGLVVRAGKDTLCQTKRSRSRKSLARTHGFR